MKRKDQLALISILTGIFLVIIFILHVTGSISALGEHIPQSDVETDYLIGSIWSIILGLTIVFWRISDEDRTALVIIWIVKSYVMFGFMLLYEAQYDFLDAYSYFKIPTQYNFEWTWPTIGQGTENIYSLVWLYYKIMPVSYHALKASFAMIGMIAVYILYRSVVLFLQRADVRVLYILTLFPSILFWSSIIGKDPLALLGIALYTYGIVGWHRFRKLRFIWILVLGVIFATFIRTWLGPILTAPVAIIFLSKIRGFLPKFITVMLITGAFLFSIAQLQDQFEIESAQAVLSTLETTSQLWSEDGGSGQKIPINFNQPHQIVTFIPLGIFTALLRPLPGEVLNLFGLLSGVENLLLLILLIRVARRKSWQTLSNPVVLWAILLVVFWASAYGFISYQNLGTAVRYRLQILPIFLCLLLYLGKQRHVTSEFRG